MTNQPTNATAELAKLRNVFTSADSTALYVHILREWPVERTREFAISLLGEQAHKDAAEFARYEAAKKPATVEGVMRLVEVAMRPLGITEDDYHAIKDAVTAIVAENERVKAESDLRHVALCQSCDLLNQGDYLSAHSVIREALLLS